MDLKMKLILKTAYIWHDMLQVVRFSNDSLKPSYLWTKTSHLQINCINSPQLSNIIQRLYKSNIWISSDCVWVCGHKIMNKVNTKTKYWRNKTTPTCDCHFICQFHNNSAREELAREVEKVGVVEHNEELGELPLVVEHSAHVVVDVHAGANIHVCYINVH